MTTTIVITLLILALLTPIWRGHRRDQREYRSCDICFPEEDRS